MANALEDLPADVQAIRSEIAAAIFGTVIGREKTAASARELAIAEASLIQCYGYAPDAPIAILREAAIRLAAWTLGSRPHAISSKVTDPSGTSLELMHQSAATANGLRASGASAALSRYVRRRAGAI